MKYGQFCPVAKAAEVLGDRWTVLIAREILMGGSRFSDLQRGLGSISTAVLTERLKTMAEDGLIVRRKVPGKRGYEYFPTASCKDLHPIILGLGEWGLRWAKDNLVDEDFDVELLMLYLERSVVCENLPGPRTILRFEFTDLKTVPVWWLIAEEAGVQVCQKDPGQEVDVYFQSTVRTMAEVWGGGRSYKDAMRAGDLTVIGDAGLTRSINRWLAPSPFSPEFGQPGVAVPPYAPRPV